MPSQSLGFGALGRYQVDIHIAVVFPGEGDEFSVRGKVGERFLAFVAGQADGIPPDLGAFQRSLA